MATSSTNMVIVMIMFRERYNLFTQKNAVRFVDGIADVDVDGDLYCVIGFYHEPDGDVDGDLDDSVDQICGWCPPLDGDCALPLPTGSALFCLITPSKGVSQFMATWNIFVV